MDFYYWRIEKYIHSKFKFRSPQYTGIIVPSFYEQCEFDIVCKNENKYSAETNRFPLKKTKWMFFRPNNRSGIRTSNVYSVFTSIFMKIAFRHCATPPSHVTSLRRKKLNDPRVGTNQRTRVRLRVHVCVTRADYVCSRHYVGPENVGPTPSSLTIY